MHTGMAQCQGTGTFNRTWGGTSWTKTLTAPDAWHQYVGRFPYNIGPAAQLQWGLWQAGLPLHYAKSEIANNAATGDAVIWCGNLEDQWSVANTGCHAWCDSGPEACGGCFEQ